MQYLFEKSLSKLILCIHSPTLQTHKHQKLGLDSEGKEC